MAPAYALRAYGGLAAIAMRYAASRSFFYPSMIVRVLRLLWVMALLGRFSPLSTGNYLAGL